MGDKLEKAKKENPNMEPGEEFIVIDEFELMDEVFNGDRTVRFVEPKEKEKAPERG